MIEGGDGLVDFEGWDAIQQRHRKGRDGVSDQVRKVQNVAADVGSALNRVEDSR